MEMEGIEPSPLTPSKTPISTKSAARCGALDDKNDAELAKLIEVWPTLPEKIETKITALVQTHEHETESR